MKRYKLLLGDKCPIEKIKYALSLFEILGYRSDVEWNDIMFDEGNVDSVYTYHSGDYRLHCDILLATSYNLFHPITLPELEALTDKFEQNKTI